MHCQIKLVLQQQEEISGKLAWAWPCGARGLPSCIWVVKRNQMKEFLFGTGSDGTDNFFPISLTYIQLD
jgi:hypothetical protein